MLLRSKLDKKAEHFLVETALPRGFRAQLPFEMILPAASQKGPRGTRALPGFKRSYFDMSAVTEKKQFHSETLFFIASQKVIKAMHWLIKPDATVARREHLLFTVFT